ncbi:terminase large subunit domain-containing protein [Phenylobacterium sp.]|jgi:phage FluMu gp28-like protein|uniref:terminase large subunit domain-containing protein n=1 Tax=Phenylobacterium sp. TaxID=1871053 RepID=UPI002F3F90A4
MSSSLDGLGPLIHFHPYQKRWLADRSRFKIGMFSRQTGKTFTNCAELVESCIDAELAGRRTRWLILSRGERQAKEAMETAVKPFTAAFWELYRGVLRGKAPEVTEDEFRGTDAAYRMFEVEFPGGSRISALPANPDTARGFSANVLLDEFGFHADSKKIWGALFPVISRTGLVLRVVSTPNGKSNKFYDLMTEEPTTWSRHVVDIHQAVAEGLDRDIDALRAGIGDADLWAQEYELKWLDEASAWLDYDLIHACEGPFGYSENVEYVGLGAHPERQVLRAVGRPPQPTNNRVYVGMDIARRKDLTCIWVSEMIGDVLYPREVITMRRAPFWAQHAELERIIRRDNPVRVSADQTGMGEAFVEEAQRRHGVSRVEGVLFTPAARFTMASLLKERMEDRRFRVPEGDRELRDDLHSITKAVTATGSVRLVHDGQSDGHGDRFWAAGLCCNAASDPYQPYDYHSVRSRESMGMSPLAQRRMENERGDEDLVHGFRGMRF